MPMRIVIAALPDGRASFSPKSGARAAGAATLTPNFALPILQQLYSCGYNKIPDQRNPDQQNFDVEFHPFWRLRVMTIDAHARLPGSDARVAGVVHDVVNLRGNKNSGAEDARPRIVRSLRSFSLYADQYSGCRICVRRAASGEWWRKG
jgi:hypothetical protein